MESNEETENMQKILKEFEKFKIEPVTEEPKEEIVEIGPLIEEIIEKNNLISKYCFNLLEKVNDLYVRLEINARVIEKCVDALNMSPEKYMAIVHEAIEEVKKVIESSPLFNSQEQSTKVD